MPFATSDDRNAYRRRYWREHWHYQGPAADDLPPGQYVACCGQWLLITCTPFPCLTCGRRFFEKEPPSC